MRDHLLTVIAYVGLAAAVAWWFWRTQGATVSSRTHAVVAVVFGLLWPVSLLYHAAAKTVAGAVARRRVRRIQQSAPSDAEVAREGSVSQRPNP